MSDRTETQRKNLILVANRILNDIDKALDDDELVVWMFSFDRMLDDLRDSDYFGTEGQNDPRGDGREGVWSMWDVEGGGKVESA